METNEKKNYHHIQNIPEKTLQTKYKSLIIKNSFKFYTKNEITTLNEITNFNFLFIANTCKHHKWIKTTINFL